MTRLKTRERKNLKVCADAMDEQFGKTVRDIAKAKMEKEDAGSAKFEVEEEPYKMNNQSLKTYVGLHQERRMLWSGAQRRSLVIVDLEHCIF